MQIVIDMDENLYTRLFDNGDIDTVDMLKACVAIRKGTPLPKGHGDLIDRRELKKDVYTTTEWNGDVHRIIYEASVDDADTIIEADKKESGE